MKIIWNKPTKIPRCTSRQLQKTAYGASIRGMSTPFKYSCRESMPILMRFAEPPTRMTKEGDPKKREPNPRFGKFTYEVGVYRYYEDAEPGFETARGYETFPDGWAWLPKAADYR